MFKKFKFLFLALTSGVFESLASEVPDIKSSQIMLNQLGYEAGPTDGIVCPKTIEAIIKYLNEKGMKFDAKIKQNEIRFLMEDTSGLSFQFKNELNSLVLLSVHYIDQTIKDQFGTYALPSRDWMKKICK